MDCNWVWHCSSCSTVRLVDFCGWAHTRNSLTLFSSLIDGMWRHSDALQLGFWIWLAAVYVRYRISCHTAQWFTVMSHERLGVPDQHELDCLLNNSVRLTAKKTSNLSQRVSSAVSVSIAWRYHAKSRIHKNLRALVSRYEAATCNIHHDMFPQFTLCWVSLG